MMHTLVHTLQIYIVMQDIVVMTLYGIYHNNTLDYENDTAATRLTEMNVTALEPNSTLQGIHILQHVHYSCTMIQAL